MPMRTPGNWVRQADASVAPDTMAQPTRLTATAASRAQSRRSPSSSHPSSTVKPADEYTSTVATAAPFTATDTVQNALKAASTVPHAARNGQSARPTRNRPGVRRASTASSVITANRSRQNASANGASA